jgi:hypothetical protein
MLVAVYILLKGDCILPLCLEEGSGKFLWHVVNIRLHCTAQKTSVYVNIAAITQFFVIVYRIFLFIVSHNWQIIYAVMDLALVWVFLLYGYFNGIALSAEDNECIACIQDILTHSWKDWGQLRTVVCEPIFWRMRKPRRRTTLWASTSWYRDSFTLFYVT